jgi:hypothetical protein
VLRFVDELLGLVQRTPAVTDKLRVLVLCDELSPLELENLPPVEFRHERAQRPRHGHAVARPARPRAADSEGGDLRGDRAPLAHRASPQAGRNALPRPGRRARPDQSPCLGRRGRLRTGRRWRGRLRQVDPPGKGLLSLEDRIGVEPISFAYLDLDKALHDPRNARAGGADRSPTARALTPRMRRLDRVFSAFESISAGTDVELAADVLALDTSAGLDVDDLIWELRARLDRIPRAFPTSLNTRWRSERSCRWA